MIFKSNPHWRQFKDAYPFTNYDIILNCSENFMSDLIIQAMFRTQSNI